MKSLNLIKLGKCSYQIANRSFSVSSYNMNKKVAVVMSGCGVFDGTEITEATSIMIHLSKNNADVTFFAPDIEQLHVINHKTGDIQPETRNVLVESARITRGNIKPLNQLKAGEFQALIIPGGFGAAKNLSDFALKGEHLTVNKDVERALNEFSLGSKPIGLCCIAPVLVSKVLPHCQVTVGMNKKGKDWPYAGTCDTLQMMGTTVVEKDVGEIHVDSNYKIVTTPAYMKNASFYEVFNGIGKMVDEVLKLAK